MATTRREVFMVESAEAAVAFRQHRLASLAQVDAITRYKEALLLAIAMYSRGDALEEVRAAVKSAVQHLESDTASPKAAFDFRDHDQFFAALWGLSLSILFGDPSMEFVQRGAGQDRVFDAFLRYTGAMVSPVQQFVRPGHKPLLDAAINPESAGQSVTAFLRTWYAGMAQTSWHDTHITHDPQFFGYWAFELAVVVKAVSISDSAFSANIFYPRDLVHQRMFRTWLEGPAGEEERKQQAVSGMGDVLGNLKGLLMAFFDGNQAGGTTQVNEGLHLLAGLLGTQPEQVKENPELLRVAMLGLVQGMMQLSREALSASRDSNSPQGKQVLDTFKELQAKIQPAEGDLAEANRILSELAPDEMDPEGMKAAAESRLRAVNQAFQDIAQDEKVSLLQLFTSMDRLIQEYGTQFGIVPPKPYDAYESTSKEVSKALDEANKKNMIGDDFDWSSIWKK